jgi:hypothetical protein
VVSEQSQVGQNSSSQLDRSLQYQQDMAFISARKASYVLLLQGSENTSHDSSSAVVQVSIGGSADKTTTSTKVTLPPTTPAHSAQGMTIGITVVPSKPSGLEGQVTSGAPSIQVVQSPQDQSSGFEMTVAQAGPAESQDPRAPHVVGGGVGLIVVVNLSVSQPMPSSPAFSAGTMAAAVQSGASGKDASAETRSTFVVSIDFYFPVDSSASFAQQTNEASLNSAGASSFVLLVDLRGNGAGWTVRLAFHLAGALPGAADNPYVGSSIIVAGRGATDNQVILLDSSDRKGEPVDFATGSNGSSSSLTLSFQDGITHMDALLTDGVAGVVLRDTSGDRPSAGNVVYVNDSAIANNGGEPPTPTGRLASAAYRIDHTTAVTDAIHWNVVIEPDADSLAGSSPLPRLESAKKLQNAPGRTNPMVVPQHTTPAGGTLPVFDLAGLLAQAMYIGHLGRPGADSGTEPTVDSLLVRYDAGMPVAALVQQSAEALTRLVREFYVLFLGRSAKPGEEQGWVGALLAGQTQEQVLSAFLSNPEFYQRASTLIQSGTPDEKFIRALYKVLLQRSASDTEVSSWLNALPTLGQQGVVSYLVASNEFRAMQVEGFYRELFHGDGSATEVMQWASAPFDLLTIRKFLEMRVESLAKSH